MKTILNILGLGVLIGIIYPIVVSLNISEKVTQPNPTHDLYCEFNTGRAKVKPIDVLGVDDLGWRLRSGYVINCELVAR